MHAVFVALCDVALDGQDAAASLAWCAYRELPYHNLVLASEMLWLCMQYRQPTEIHELISSKNQGIEAVQGIQCCIARMFLDPTFVTQQILSQPYQSSNCYNGTLHLQRQLFAKVV